MKERDYSKMPEADVIVDYIYSRHKKGLYTLTLFTGLPGTGKSSSCVRLGELVSLRLTSKNIITSENVIDSLLDLVSFVGKANPEDINIAIVEEVSVLFPSRRAMASDNVAIGKILDTCRKKKVILIVNAPIWTSIDSHMRVLGNLYIETLRINKEWGVVVCKPLRLQANPSNGKVYWHWLRRSGKGVQRVFFRRPNSKTWEEYEHRKDKFMNELYEELKFKAIKKKDALMKEMGKSAKTKIIKPLTPMELKVYDMKIRGNMKTKEIAEEIGCSSPNITQILNRIKKKMAISLGDEQNNVIFDDTEAIK
jgi:DNA-binding CsgD family transcriptional regulator